MPLLIIETRQCNEKLFIFPSICTSRQLTCNIVAKSDGSQGDSSIIKSFQYVPTLKESKGISREENDEAKSQRGKDDSVKNAFEPS